MVQVATNITQRNLCSHLYLYLLCLQWRRSDSKSLHHRVVRPLPRNGLFLSCLGLQTVRPQLRLPHIRQRLPDTQVESSLSQNLKRCRRFSASLLGANKTHQSENPIKLILYIHRPGIKTKKTLHSALDTKKISTQNTLIKNKIFPQVAEKSSLSLF